MIALASGILAGEGIENLTWMLSGEQCDKTRSKESWNALISSRDTEVGSGRRRQADKDAFAMTS